MEPVALHRMDVATERVLAIVIWRALLVKSVDPQKQDSFKGAIVINGTIDTQRSLCGKRNTIHVSEL